MFPVFLTVPPPPLSLTSLKMNVQNEGEEK